ncbi:hypothetical protein [Synoicihabitans lomoniglobus]|uniref:Uncharacterized protein n=1 Tax=Synoicihabitans lomoniglobus TaxID=2909285 RepID=A0AAF0CP35_9BACT|nr:hypothetical protein [Opitutaceae bacterium LMO-M01]WED63304.1 hypothetical protein PXH66_13280 [Opitutaceae bacterium LMO-M01]
METFRSLYCAQHHLPSKAYPHAALRACLRWPGRLMYWPLRVLASDFFASDLDLIHNVGRLTTPYDLSLDITEYRYHPFNQSRLRRTFGLCISTSTLRRIVFHTFNRESTAADAARPVNRPSTT